jgi:hypothetical protein
MNRVKLILAAAGVSLAMIFTNGCATKGKIAASAMEVAEKRAPFDMECDEVTSQVLGDVNVYHEQLAEVNVGVIGCNKKASYVVRCTPGGWAGEKVDCTPNLNSIKE